MSVVLLISNYPMLLGGIYVLIVGIGFIVVAAYVSFSSQEQLQRHRRLRKLKDRHIGEMLATGLMFTAFASVLLVKLWFGSGSEPSELGMGLMLGFFLIFVLSVVALLLFRIISKLRD